MTTDPALIGFALAAALHAGFQLTVTGVAYPALARVPDDEWRANHEAHSRQITPLVVLTYGAVLATAGWMLLDRGVGARSAWVLVALAALGFTFVTTALLAAPTHGRLAPAKDAHLVRRLLVVDRLRAGGAVVGLVAACLALF